MSKQRIAASLVSFALAGALLGAVASGALGKAGGSITAGDGPFVFGHSYTTEQVVAAFSPKNGNRQPDGGYWARINCSQSGALVYAQFADLTVPIVQSGFTFGPTPSWSGGGADCVILLYAMNDGAFSSVLASDTLEAVP
jgi:hypothetical protein